MRVELCRYSVEKNLNTKEKIFYTSLYPTYASGNGHTTGTNTYTRRTGRPAPFRLCMVTGEGYFTLWTDNYVDRLVFGKGAKCLMYTGSWLPNHSNWEPGNCAHVTLWSPKYTSASPCFVSSVSCYMLGFRSPRLRKYLSL